MQFDNSAPKIVQCARIVTVIYLAFALIITVNCNFDACGIQFSNVILFGIAVIASFVLVVICFRRGMKHKGKSIFEKRFNVTMLMLSALLLLIQFAVVCFASFRTGWDPEVVFKSAMQFANGEEMTEAWYFSRYSNNYGIVLIECLLIKICGLFGIHSQQGCYMFLEMIGYVLITISLLLMSYIIRKTTKSSFFALWGWSIGAIWIGISPWGLIPYTDSYGMLFTIAGLYCYICVNEPLTKWISLVVITIVGSSVKPTVCILFIAVVVVELFCLTAKKTRKCWKLLLRDTVAVIIVAGIVFSLQKFLFELVPVTVKENERFGIAHFAMMGLNSETNGSFNEKDVQFSAQFSSEKERKEKNIEVWKNRVETMKCSGLLKLGLNKTKLNYCDGTFTWAGEGDFYVTIYGENTIVQKFYGINSGQGIFRVIAQVIWIIVLLLSVFGFFRRKATKEECVTYVAVLGISLFLLIFECRGRYLFLYSPYYILMSIWGIQVIAEFLKKLVVEKDVRVQ